ncbi:sigma 54-interacting transcriptional regulator [Thermosulfuriphilus sp.]
MEREDLYENVKSGQQINIKNVKSLDALELEVLYAISEVISDVLELDKALRRVLGILSETLAMERATITLLDESTQRLVIRASHGLSPEEEQRGIYAVGEGITGQVFASGQPCVVPDVRSDPLFLNKTGARSVTKERLSFIAVPIILKRHPIGVLSVDKLFGKDVDPAEDIKFLKIVAALIAHFVSLNQQIAAREKLLRLDNLNLRQELKSRLRRFFWHSKSPLMQRTLEMVRKVAPTKATVLLLGESGTGKTMTARLIHELSPRAEKPFVKINCAALPENLLEAELFGYEKGAFTGAVTSKSGRLEEAHGGTVFLDEIGELPPSLQAKLLRFIQEREFERLGSTKTREIDVRLIAATNRNLEEAVSKGEFRADLYFRLSVFPLKLPPLRKRPEDIPLLLNFFCEKATLDYGRRILLTPKAIERLVRYPWPGNIREMENIIERLAIVCEKIPIEPEDLEPFLQKDPGCLPEEEPLPEMESQPLREVERREILLALKRNQWVLTWAAKDLGLTLRQLRYRIQKLGLHSAIPHRRGRPPLKKNR